jgi:hypothetical protein
MKSSGVSSGIWVAPKASGRDGTKNKEHKMKIVKTTILAGLLAGTMLAPAAPALAKDKDYGEFRVPPGHVPPPGACRIWFPGRPPGHQPKPGSCRVLSRQVPRGAYLIANDRRWTYGDLSDRRFRYDVFDGPRYSHRDYDRDYLRRSQIREDVRDVRAARREVAEDRQQLQRNADELRKDRAELKRDIQSGAGRKEIAQDRREIREGREKVADAKKDLQRSENRLERERSDLRR